MQMFDAEQMHRYEIFRKTGLSRPAIARLIQRVTGQPNASSINPDCLIVIAGAAKVLLGQIVEAAVEVAAEQGIDTHQQPLLPSHITEAFRRLQDEQFILK